MIRLAQALLAGMLALAALPCAAGGGCREHVATPGELASAAGSAQRVLVELEARDQPLALLARHGTDLSEHGLHYSHLGFVVRDHADGRWTVVHLLNTCGSNDSGLYAQGLVNFFLDDLVSQDALLVWLEPEDSRRVLELLSGDGPRRLYDPDYNVIARHDSLRTQNSTAWALEILAAAGLSDAASADRRRAQAQLRAEGFQPSLIRIPYAQRVLGGLFSANADFSDHPVAARLAGRYLVVSVDSILAHLERRERIAARWEWRDGRRRED